MTVTLIINTENLSKRRARCAKEGYSSLSLVDIKETDARYTERLGTYLAAAGAYEALFSRPMPRLYFDENGKPFFEGYVDFSSELDSLRGYSELRAESESLPLNDGDNLPHKDGLYISLSHRHGRAAVSFSDCPVGVDIEGHIAKLMLGRLTKRLLSQINGTPEPLSLKYMTAMLNECGELVDLCELSPEKLERLPSPIEKVCEQGTVKNPILAFTALEAAAKCTGLGIAKFLGTGADITGFSADSIYFDGYTVTTFIKR